MKTAFVLTLLAVLLNFGESFSQSRGNFRLDERGFLIVPSAPPETASSGIASKLGLHWTGFYVGAQVVNDFKTPVRGQEYALTANTIIGFKKFYDIQFQIIYPVSKVPTLYRVAIGAKIF